MVYLHCNRFLGMHHYQNCRFSELALAPNGICSKGAGAKLCRTAMCAKMIRLRRVASFPRWYAWKCPGKHNGVESLTSSGCKSTKKVVGMLIDWFRTAVG